jgi:hypothetical protein
MDWTWSDIQRAEDGREPAPLTFTPGVDFDPWDAEEVEIVKLATGRSAADRLRHLERENSRLRALLGENDD